MMTQPQFKIRAVGAGDVDEVTGILTDAHLHSALGAWLTPTEASRRAQLAVYFRRVAEHIVRHGIVEGAPAIGSSGLDGVALWLRADDPVYIDEIGYDRYRQQVFGTDTARRFAALEHVMFWRQHPAPDEYLAFLAVRPPHHGHGLGDALLRHHVLYLDNVRLNAGVHAVGPESQAWFAAHGFHAAEPADLPAGGPQLCAVWREPNPYNQ
jgi:GNAT superfamily N-acetyltransferase